MRSYSVNVITLKGLNKPCRALSAAPKTLEFVMLSEAGRSYVYRHLPGILFLWEKGAGLMLMEGIDK
jgi:hypothetical protein